MAFVKTLETLMIRKPILIINKLGLHARAAAKFVSTASRFASQIEVARDTKLVNGKSIMGVMMLGAGKGVIIELIIAGEDEQEAFSALEKLVNHRFDEAE